MTKSGQDAQVALPGNERIMPYFKHDGLEFHYQDKGEGTPFIFQHGLGGDVSQPFGLFSPPPGFRLLAFDCRGHGQTHPLGDPAKIRISSFADDLRAFMDQLELKQAVVGGISMGAAITLNFTLRYPERVLGLVQSRAAWLDGPMEHNARVFGEIARLIRKEGPERGFEIFKKSKDYLETKRQSTDSANALEASVHSPSSHGNRGQTRADSRRCPQFQSAGMEIHSSANSSIGKSTRPDSSF